MPDGHYCHKRLLRGNQSPNTARHTQPEEDRDQKAKTKSILRTWYTSTRHDRQHLTNWGSIYLRHYDSSFARNTFKHIFYTETTAVQPHIRR